MIEANFKIKKYKKQNAKQNKRIPLICESILVPISLKKKFWFLYPLKKHFGAYIPLSPQTSDNKIKINK